MTKPTAHPSPLDRDPDFAPDPAAVPPAPLVSDAAVRTICHWVAGTVLGLAGLGLIGWVAWIEVGAGVVLGLTLMLVFFLLLAHSTM